MAFAQGSRSGLSYIEETTFGTTPAGNFTAIPYNTHSLNLTKDRVTGGFVDFNHKVDWRVARTHIEDVSLTQPGHQRVGRT